MGTICLALLLIVAAIGIDGLQPSRSNADQHYHHHEENAKADIEDNTDDEDGVIASEPRVGCVLEPGHGIYLCYMEGCNPDNPKHYCFKYIHCNDNPLVCQDYRDCMERQPCYGPCWGS